MFVDESRISFSVSRMHSIFETDLIGGIAQIGNTVLCEVFFCDL